MDISSWFRRNETSVQKPQQPDQRILGVTDQLVDRVKSFTLDTFKNFPQRHAMLVLSKVKELSQVRYKLCPGYMEEHQFWRVYFSLVKTNVAEYELQAIGLAKIKEMALENGKSTDENACEVGMAETKNSANLQRPSP